MMSVGLHCRIVGRPGRLKSLERFLDYVLEHKDVWICKRKIKPETVDKELFKYLINEKIKISFSKWFN